LVRVQGDDGSGVRSQVIVDNAVRANRAALAIRNCELVNVLALANDFVVDLAIA